MQPRILVTRDGQQFGPYSVHEVRVHLASGHLAGEDLAWHEGLPDWVSLGSLVPAVPAPTLAAPSAPPARPTMPQVFRPPGAPAIKHERAEDDAELPRPWRRYFARHLDYAVFGATAGILMVVLGFEDTLDQLNDYVVGLAIVAAWTFGEAASLSLSGTTPGKFLLNVWVARRAGGRPGFFTALGRAWSVLLLGMGLGIPIVALVTCITSYNRLQQEGVTAWDEARHLVVRSPGRAWWVWVLAWLGLALILGLLLFAASLVLLIKDGGLEE